MLLEIALQWKIIFFNLLNNKISKNLYLTNIDETKVVSNSGEYCINS